MADDTQKISAADRYAQLKPNRKEAESLARRCAKVTLPRLWVDEGTRNRRAGSAYIDTGPKCVNTLAAKVLLAWLPPNAGLFKMAPDVAAKEAIAQEAGVQASELELALAEIERAVINDFETSGVRTVLAEAAKHAIVTGNFLLYDPDEGPTKLYPLNTYVVDRDGLGNVLEIITLDKVAPKLLPESLRATVMQKVAETSGGDISRMNDDVNLYTRISRTEDNSQWEVVQEVEGVEVPETSATYPLEACPWIPVAVPRSATSDYGEGLVYDYVGAFESLEALRKAVRKGAAALAKVIILLSPTSAIREKQLAQAESGAIVRGNRNDVATLQLDKTVDLNFVRQEADALAKSLELIFGVRSAVQRPGERVTGYEIRVLTQELDDSLGGFYSLTAEDLLLPLVRRRLDKLQRQGRLPEIPKELLKPRITVGVAALGRGHDLMKLMEFGDACMKTLGEQETRRRINSGELIARLAAAADISSKGLIRSDEELAQEQQEGAMQDALVSAAPQLANNLTQPSQ
ncbi:MAG: portal protein [Pseudomonadota bacterium]|nr:portal protein [Pseudomonadota bacterium]